MPLHVSLPWTRWIQGGRDVHSLGFPLEEGIHSEYTEHIRKFKYRQGNRPAGEHLRDVLSITNSAFLANRPIQISLWI